MPRKKDFHDKPASKPPEKRPFNVIPFECAEVKSEPEDNFSDDRPEIFIPWPSHQGAISVATQTSKHRTATRAVQADLLPVAKDSIVPGGPGLDEPLGPDLTKGAVEKQCRICLRRLPEASLAYILFPQKTRILTTLGVKVYLGDAYPFICRNCAALVDLMYDFRSACLKARNMLVHDRKSFAGDGWDSDENLGAILRVKSLVESHRKEVDAGYELSSLGKGTCDQEEEMEDVKIKPEAIELVMVEPTPIESSSSEDEEDYSNHSLRIDHGGGHSDSDSESESPSEGENQSLLSALSSLPVAPPKKKRIRIVTKPYRKRQKKKVKEESDDENPDQGNDGERKDGKARKRRKNAADPNRKRGALCDFCGEWVEYHTVESHKNQHLGIKPYICQTEGCKLAFSCRNLLVKHIKRQHGADGPEYHDCNICGHRIKGPKAALKKHQKTHTEEKNFICAVCGKGFTTQGYLRQHSIIHTDLMPFECGVCHRKFNNKYNMLTHEKKHFQRGEMVPSESFNPVEANSNGPSEGERGGGAGQRPEVSTTTLTVEPAPTPLPPFANYHQIHHQLQQNQSHHTNHLHQQQQQQQHHLHHPHIHLLQIHPPHPLPHPLPHPQQQPHHQPLLHQQQ